MSPFTGDSKGNRIQNILIKKTYRIQQKIDTKRTLNFGQIHIKSQIRMYNSRNIF